MTNGQGIRLPAESTHPVSGAEAHCDELATPARLMIARRHVSQALEILNGADALTGPEATAALNLKAELTHAARALGNLAVFATSRCAQPRPDGKRAPSVSDSEVTPPRRS